VISRRAAGGYTERMSAPRDALAAGRLADAVELQDAVVRGRPGDPAARLFLFELLALAGRLRDARDHLREVESDAPDWPAVRRNFLRLLKAEHSRSHRNRKPAGLLPWPAHARMRWRGVRGLRAEAPAAADWCDRADAAAPLVAGHIDGREFEGLRDTDDRYAAAFELLVGAEYVWVPFEQVKRLTLAPPAGALDAAFRPARVLLATGDEVAGVVPLVYPGSHTEDGAFAAGQDTDWRTAGGGVTCGVGARVYLAGDEEVMLNEIRQFELRTVQ
jgi:type VI secretion system protein ImpE